MRTRLAALAIALLGSTALLGGSVAAAAEIADPCAGPEAQRLLCPNLRIGAPSEMYLQDAGPGRQLLRATSDVRSRGRGPIELRGTRSGPRSMRTRQRIYRAGGGHVDVPSDATLNLTNVGEYFGGIYWKVHQLARFELVPATPGGKLLGGAVRSSPKLNYCLRDLERTRPGHRSPATRHYPACNQDPYRDGVTLGTSVGWSDIYPADYDKQFINVAGLRGCFAFRMTVDPQRLLYESDERDNSSQRLVRLPFRGATGC